MQDNYVDKVRVCLGSDRELSTGKSIEIYTPSELQRRVKPPRFAYERKSKVNLRQLPVTSLMLG